MTPKERTLAALRHQQPDQVPVGEFAVDYAVIEEILGRPSFLRGKRKLIEALWQGRRDEVVESIKRDTVDLTLELGYDMVRADLVPDKDREFPPPRQVNQETWEDDWGAVYRFSDLTHDIVLMKAPDKAPPPYEDPAQRENGLRLPTESELEVVDHVIDKLGGTHFVWTGAATGPVGLPFFSALWVEPWVLTIIEQPEQVRRARFDRAEMMKRAAGFWKSRGVDAVMGAEDLGYNRGPFMSPCHFRELFLPGYQAQAAAVHETGLPLLFHSCGNLTQIWDGLAEAGFDAYQAIQPEEDLAELKRRHGRQIALWGGVSCHSLVVKEPDDICQEVVRACEVAMPGGGFILGSSHSVGVATKPENLVAMVKAAREYGRY